MGFFDSLKKAMGGKKAPQADVTVGPSQVLRENGIDPSTLDFSFGADGTVTISGTAASEAERQKIVELVSGIAGVSAVNDRTSVAPPPAPEPPAAPEPAPPPPAPEAPVVAAPEPEVSSAPSPEPATQAPATAAKTYTVQPGDSLWKIAEAHYGNGSKYMKIFEANQPLLEDPDKIFPGQELVIPDLEN